MFTPHTQAVFPSFSARLLGVTALVMILVVLLVAPVAASDQNCWGVVSSQRAQADGGLGQHTSDQDTPRLGLGNLARILGEAGVTDGTHISDLGRFLADVDGIDETHCSDSE